MLQPYPSEPGMAGYRLRKMYPLSASVSFLILSIRSCHMRQRTRPICEESLKAHKILLHPPLLLEQLTLRTLPAGLLCRGHTLTERVNDHLGLLLKKNNLLEEKLSPLYDLVV